MASVNMCYCLQRLQVVVVLYPAQGTDEAGLVSFACVEKTKFFKRHHFKMGTQLLPLGKFLNSSSLAMN